MVSARLAARLGLGQQAVVIARLAGNADAVTRATCSARCARRNVGRARQACGPPLRTAEPAEGTVVRLSSTVARFPEVWLAADRLAARRTTGMPTPACFVRPRAWSCRITRARRRTVPSSSFAAPSATPASSSDSPPSLWPVLAPSRATDRLSARRACGLRSPSIAEPRDTRRDPHVTTTTLPGRRSLPCAIPDTPLAAAVPGIDTCVHCGFCLQACPDLCEPGGRERQSARSHRAHAGRRRRRAARSTTRACARTSTAASVAARAKPRVRPVSRTGSCSKPLAPRCERRARRRCSVAIVLGVFETVGVRFASCCSRRGSCARPACRRCSRAPAVDSGFASAMLASTRNALPRA